MREVTLSHEATMMGWSSISCLVKRTCLCKLDAISLSITIHQLLGRLDPTYSIGRVEAPLSLCEPRQLERLEMIRSSFKTELRRQRAIEKITSKILCSLLCITKDAKSLRGSRMRHSVAKTEMSDECFPPRASFTVVYHTTNAFGSFELTAPLTAAPCVALHRDSSSGFAGNMTESEADAELLPVDWLSEPEPPPEESVVCHATTPARRGHEPECEPRAGLTQHVENPID